MTLRICLALRVKRRKKLAQRKHQYEGHGTRPNQQLRNVRDIGQRISHIDLGAQYVSKLAEKKIRIVWHAVSEVKMR